MANESDDIVMRSIAILRATFHADRALVAAFIETALKAKAAIEAVEPSTITIWTKH
jgi:hypothetical protein